MEISGAGMTFVSSGVVTAVDTGLGRVIPRAFCIRVQS